MAVFLKYTNKETGKVFYTSHEVENEASFLRKVGKISQEIGRDAKCDVQECSEEAYHSNKGRLL